MFVRLFGVLGAILVAGLMAATPAFAHAKYKSSNPPDGGTVASAPSEITAEFTEPMSGGSYMDVTDPCGRDVGTNSEQTGSSMRVQNAGVAAGTYVVFYKAVSIDTHATVGEFEFTVTDGEPCPGDEPPSESDPGGGGGNGDPGEASGLASDSGDVSTVADPGDANRSGHSGGRHDEHSRMKDGKERRADGNGDVLAQGPQSHVPDAPSALEGIPLDGLLLTLGVSALIGAAAGKIYVSLSGDDS